MRAAGSGSPGGSGKGRAPAVMLAGAWLLVVVRVSSAMKEVCQVPPPSFE